MGGFSAAAIIGDLRIHYDVTAQAHAGFMMKGMGRTLIVVGLILVAVGVLFTLGEKLPVKLGRLPGDITVRGKNGVFYFPIVTSLLLSVVLSVLLWLFGRR
jgi:DUF2905 family protein